jgi:hypothetical protein
MGEALLSATYMLQLPIESVRRIAPDMAITIKEE